MTCCSLTSSSRLTTRSFLSIIALICCLIFDSSRAGGAPLSSVMLVRNCSSLLQRLTTVSIVRDMLDDTAFGPRGDFGMDSPTLGE